MMSTSREPPVTLAVSSAAVCAIQSISVAGWRVNECAHLEGSGVSDVCFHDVEVRIVDGVEAVGRGRGAHKGDDRVAIREQLLGKFELGRGE